MRRETGRLHLARGSFRQAADELLGATIDKNPDDLETWLLYIDVLAHTKNVEAAQGQLTAVLKRFVGNPEVELARGGLARARAVNAANLAKVLEAYQKAQRELEAHAAPKRLLAEAMARSGEALALGGDYGRAEPHLQQATDTDPSNAVAWYWLGVTRSSGARWGGARDAYQQALKLNPELGRHHPDLWFFLGEALWNLRDRDAGIKAWETYVRLDPHGEFVDQVHQR